MELTEGKPWYLRPFTEEERSRCAVAPWNGVPEHLRPRFLESEIEYRMRIAFIRPALEE